MKSITKLFAFIALLSITSCNIDAPDTDFVSDFGNIISMESENLYTIQTDDNGLVYSSETPYKIKKEDIGKRVRVEYTVISEGMFANNVSIMKMGYTPSATAYSQSTIDSWSPEKRTEFLDTLGSTAMQYSSVNLSNRGYLNMIFSTLTSNSGYTPNGYSTLIFDDVTVRLPEDDTLRYSWHYRAKGDARNRCTDYASFILEPFFKPGKTKYPIQIKYKELESGTETVIKFDINTETNEDEDQML